MRRQNGMGLVLLIIGVVILLKALNAVPFNLFFDGWWTLFLIVPALMSMSRQGLTNGNIILLILGFGFLINEQVGWDFAKYIVPGIFILLGVSILIRK